MKGAKNLIIDGLALLLIAAAALVVYRLVCSDWSTPTARLMPSFTRAKRIGPANKWVTYRFLSPDEPGGVKGKLRLARFVYGHLSQGMTWDSYSVDHWQSWVGDVFSREMGWVSQDQPGWLVSTWLCADERAEYYRDHLFWSIQALRFLDPEITDKEIRMIEGSGKTVRIRLTQACTDYDYGEDTLYWNPAETQGLPVDKQRREQWFRTDTLIALGCQLSHMRHDLCQDGDTADGQERDGIATSAELRIRDMLSRKDPTRACILPTPDHQDTDGGGDLVIVP